MSTVLRDDDGASPAAAAPAAARHRRTITSALSRWLWYERSVRTQLLGTFVVINLVAGFAAAVIVIYNGQRAIEAELAAYVTDDSLGGRPLSERTRIVVLNKADVPEARELADGVGPAAEPLVEAAPGGIGQGGEGISIAHDLYKL